MYIDEELSLTKEELLGWMSEKFNRLLKEKGYGSTNKFADAFDFPRAQIYAFSMGSLNITAWSLFKICEALEVTLEVFFEDLHKS